MTTHSSILAWKILWTEEPCGLQSMGLQRVGHDRVWAWKDGLLVPRCNHRIRSSWSASDWEFPGKRMQTSKHSGVWRLQVPWSKFRSHGLYKQSLLLLPGLWPSEAQREKYISVCFTLQLTVQWRLWHSCDFCFSNKFKFTILETLCRWKSVLYWTTSPV